MAGMSVALSGGGHRATLFGLGAMMYLADARLTSRVTSVASVSGGSITNGYIAQAVDLETATQADFHRHVSGPLARQIARRGTLFATWRTQLYLLVLVLSLAVPSVFVWVADWSGALSALLQVVVVVLWVWLALGARGRVCARAFRDTLYSPEGRASLLAEVDRGPVHVLCATDLRSGGHVYFSPRFVYGYRFGPGVPGDLPLHQAVQASASLPGAFPAKWLPTGRHRFAGPPAGAGPTDPPRWLVLTDGGVYDNMADQWASGFANRLRVWSGLGDCAEEPEELVVVNASAGMEWTPFRTGALPLLGEISVLLRAKSILYDKTTAQRRSGLVGRFDRAVLTGDGMRGALVHIAQSPFTAARAFENATEPWDERAERARAVIEALGEENEEAWADAARDNAQVKTTLSKLGREVSARLLHHGYVLAMCNLHVILGHPLLEVPDRTMFEAIVA